MRLPDRDGIDTVILDAGGVLLLPDAAVGRDAFRSLGYQPCDEEWERAHYANVVLYDGMDLPDWAELRRAFARALGVADRHIDAAVPLVDSLITTTPWAPVAGAAAAVQALVGAGFKVGIVSNAFGTIAAQLEGGRVCSASDATTLPRVAAIIDSHLVGVEKPDPAIFHLALDALGADASRAVHVGDSVRADVNGASGAGLCGVHLDPYGGCGGAHAHVSGLPALLDWLISPQP